MRVNTVAGLLIRGMSRRSRFNPEMHKAVDVLKKQYEGFQDEFERFFLDLQAHVAE
jgi:acyl carrier protein phosphodiesterase